MDFYKINEGYVQFLQEYEKKRRKKQEANILIRIPGDKRK